MLLSPNYEGIRHMYEEFVCLFYDVTRDQIKPYYEGEAASENFLVTEMYVESIPVIAFVRLLTKIMQASGVYDFGLKDLFKPDYERTRRNISAIINLGKYREDKVITFTK